MKRSDKTNTSKNDYGDELRKKLDRIIEQTNAETKALKKILDGLKKHDEENNNHFKKQ